MKEIKIGKITNKDVEEMVNGVSSNELLRDGLCGQDISNIDLSELSVENFKKLSFDSSTIFSKKQLEKFNPYRPLEESKNPSKYIEELHDNGVDGTGQKIAIIDTNIDTENELFNNSNLEFIEDVMSGEKEVHGATVLSALLQVVPNANVKYYADNKYDKNRDENILGYIKDIIKDGDIKIISMSSRIKDDKIKKEVQELLEQNDVALIDSETFYKKFTYCFREFDSNGEEKFQEAFCEEEENNIQKREVLMSQVKSVLDSYGIDSSNMESAFDILKQNLIRDGREKDVAISEEKKQLLLSDNVYGKNGYNYIQKQKAVEKEQKERLENGSIEVPCGGRTFIGKNGAYKYFGTCSASYTIPQVAGYFALAKQAQKDLSFDEFVKACDETSQKVGHRKIINPLQMINSLQEREIVKENEFIKSLKSNVKDISAGSLETEEDTYTRSLNGSSISVEKTM